MCWYTLSEILHAYDMLEANWHKNSSNIRNQKMWSTSVRVESICYWHTVWYHYNAFNFLSNSQMRTIHTPYIFCFSYWSAIWNIMLWIKRVIATPRWSWKSHERVVLESCYICIIEYRLFVQNFVGEKKKNWSFALLPLCEWNKKVTDDCPRQWPVMRKTITCHDVIMGSLSGTNWGTPWV